MAAFDKLLPANERQAKEAQIAGVKGMRVAPEDALPDVLHIRHHLVLSGAVQCPLALHDAHLAFQLTQLLVSLGNRDLGLLQTVSQA